MPGQVLHPADHQIAGHGFDGPLGSQVDESGRFYKPLQGDERGDREIDLYNKMPADEEVPPHIRSFLPKYFGTVAIEAADGGEAVSLVRLDDNSLQRHGVMEDLTHRFHHPSIIDLKIGSRTWYPEANDHNMMKNKLKDKLTTSGTLGFRVSGMQVYEPSKGTTYKVSSQWAKNMSSEEAIIALKRYVSSNPQDEIDPDGVLATCIYGGPHGVIAQLEVLKDWFSTQTYYHFASSSVLIIYEGDLMSINDRKSQELDVSNSVMVKFIDFAHTIYGKSSLDENFLEGLKSVISFLSRIVEAQTVQ